MPKTVLTAAQVHEVREKYSSGVPIKQLASTYGVGYEQARRIVRGKTWKKVLQVKGSGMTFKISTEDDMYTAVTAIHKHFIDNPDEPYIELVYDRDGRREVVGRINNPSFTQLIYDVSYHLDKLKRENTERTVQINTK